MPTHTPGSSRIWGPRARGDIDESKLAEQGIQALLAKPFRTESLRALIDRLVAH